MAANSGRPNAGLTLAKLFVALIGTAVLAAGVALPLVGGFGLAARNEANRFLDTKCDLQVSKPPQRTTLLASDGKTVLATLFKQDRQEIALSAVPKYLVNALIATEDRRFYSHHGVDLRGLIRSAVSTSSGDTQGGSTLTMQYVKQARYYAAGDDIAKQNAAIAQTLDRKIEDARCALYLENTKHETKDQILTDYLNIAFFGENSYGIQTAAETYFNKPASQLTLGESATLVGLLRAPSAYDPFMDKAAATDRRNEVLQNLVATRQLSQTQATAEAAKPIALATDSAPQVRQGCANSVSTAQTMLNSAFFCEYAVQWLKSVQKMTDTQLDTGGYTIVTTIDKDVQNSVQTRLSKSIPATSPMTAVMPVVQPSTGHVLAMATSKGYGLTAPTQTEQPVFTKPTGQAASTYKLFPLLQALSTGMGGNLELESETDTDGSYKSKKCLTAPTTVNGDANETYTRNETLQSATVKSSNTYFIALTDQMFGCHLTPMVTLAQSLGLTTSLEAESDIRGQTVGQALISQQRAQQFVLGSVETSPLEMAGAYAAIANGGEFNPPTPIISIRDAAGNLVAVKQLPSRQAVAPQVAANAVNLLIGDTRGNGTAKDVFSTWYTKHKDGLISGKTGTQVSELKKNKNAAVWFVGMTPKYVAASALINFDSPSYPSSGLPGMATGAAYGDYAAKIWLNAMRPTLTKDSNWTWPDPSLVGSIEVPPLGGKSEDDARQILDTYGLKLTVTDPTFQCPSFAPFNTIGYYGPTRAQSGDTISACISQGLKPHIYTPPPPPKKKVKPSPGAGTSTSPAPGGGSTPTATAPVGGGGATRTRGRPHR